MRMPGPVAVALVAAACAGGSGIVSPAGTEEVVEPIRVIDGDSLMVSAESGDVEVRLAGVNAPETGECHHTGAVEALEELVGDGSLTMARMGTDQFGRVLARITSAGRDVTRQLVEGGHALAVGGVPDHDELARSEEAAYRAGLGLWSSAGCGRGPLPSLHFDQEASVTDPPGNDEERLADEVIVLVSDEERPLDLAGWLLRDASSRHRLLFGDATVLGPGDRLMVSSADARWTPGETAIWSNGGDVVLLLDPDGRVVARWRYRGR